MADAIQRGTDGQIPAGGGPRACDGSGQEARVSVVTIYAWRKRYGQLEAGDVKRLRQLELENGRLKKLVAERDLDIEILKEVAAKKW
jgi:putative transposase